MTPAFTLPSNDGWSTISFACIGDIRVKGARVLVLRIEAEGTYWDRAVWEGDGGATGGERVPDFSVVLHQVLVTAESLGRLADALQGWLDDRESEVAFAFDCPDDQRLSLFIGKHPDFVLGLEKAVFSLCYTANRLAPVEIRFVVEETCVRMMKDGVEEMRRALG